MMKDYGNNKLSNAERCGCFFFQIKTNYGKTLRNSCFILQFIGMNVHSILYVLQGLVARWIELLLGSQTARNLAVSLRCLTVLQVSSLKAPGPQPQNVDALEGSCCGSHKSIMAHYRFANQGSHDYVIQ